MVAGEGSASGDFSEGIPAESQGARTAPLAYVFLVLMVLIGSSTAAAAKFVVHEVPVALIPLVRFGLAGLLLLPLVWKTAAFRTMFRRDWRRLALTAACCVPINQTFFLNGTRLAPTTHIALIYAACPLVVLALATALRQERLSAGRLLGVLASVAGLIVIALGNLLGDRTPESRGVLLGDLLLVGAVTSWGAYITLGKPLVARYGSLPTLAGTFLVGGLLNLPVALATSGSWTWLASVSPRAWVALIHLTLVVSVLGLLFQNLALARLDASQVATFGNASPLLTMLWGNLIFAERLTPTLAFGGALILLGVVGTSRPARGPAVVHEPFEPAPKPRLAMPRVATAAGRPTL
jgi:drug/metabolite transporter (DMT)-like permease